jgi:hypothetical protein
LVPGRTYSVRWANAGSIPFFRDPAITAHTAMKLLTDASISVKETCIKDRAGPDEIRTRLRQGVSAPCSILRPRLVSISRDGRLIQILSERLGLLYGVVAGRSIRYAPDGCSWRMIPRRLGGLERSPFADSCEVSCGVSKRVRVAQMGEARSFFCDSSLAPKRRLRTNST